MDNSTWQWLATGLASLCVTFGGIVIHFINAESKRQATQITTLWEYYGKTETRLQQAEARLAYIKGALANCKELDFNGDW